MAQQVLELADPGLVLALLLASGVVAAVLAQVALIAGGFDALGDLGTTGPAEVLELLGQPVECLLAEPGLFGCGLLGHIHLLNTMPQTNRMPSAADACPTGHRTMRIPGHPQVTGNRIDCLF